MNLDRATADLREHELAEERSVWNGFDRELAQQLTDSEHRLDGLAVTISDADEVHLHIADLMAALPDHPATRAINRLVDNQIRLALDLKYTHAANEASL